MHVGVRVEWKPRLPVSKTAVWFGAPRHGRAHRIAPEVEPGDVALPWVLHQMRRNRSVDHPNFFPLVDSWRSPQGEQQHGGDSGLGASDPARNSGSVVVPKHPVRPRPDRQCGFVGFDERRDGLWLPVGRDQVEVERQVEAGQIRSVIGHQLVDREVGLPDHDPIRIGVSDPSHRPDRRVHARLIDGSDLQPALFGRHPRLPIGIGRIVAILLILVEMVDSIHPKPVNTSVEPKSQHVAHGLLDLRIAPIEVRLLLEVRVVIVLTSDFVESPGGTAKLALPIVRWGTVRLRVSPDIPVPPRIGLRGATLQKPGMFIGGMVRHEIKDDLDAARVRGLKKRIEVRERAEKGVDGAVVANVIPKVSHRRGKDRGDPNRVDSEIDQVLQPERNPLEIADAVTIRVLERSRVYLVDDSSLPPCVRFHDRSKSRRPYIAVALTHLSAGGASAAQGGLRVATLSVPDMHICSTRQSRHRSVPECPCQENRAHRGQWKR